jgi:hypothetical protein
MRAAVLFLGGKVARPHFNKQARYGGRPVIADTQEEHIGVSWSKTGPEILYEKQLKQKMAGNVA